MSARDDPRAIVRFAFYVGFAIGILARPAAIALGVYLAWRFPL